MDSRPKLSYHARLLLYLLLFFGIFLSGCLAFQYRREKTFKAESLHYKLQVLNAQIADAIRDGESPTEFLHHNNLALPGEVRLTIIHPDGTVSFDSQKGNSVGAMSNHLSRPEVRQAVENGSGYTIRRLSESTDQPYFYSATRMGDSIVRTALPYTVSLREMLRADRHFLWFMCAAAFIISGAGFLVTRRLGHTILRLREFALKADRGEPIDALPPFPHDNLGEISTHIIQLYAQLQHAKDALVAEHDMVLRQEQEKIRIKKQLTQNINHELKTPVSSIQGYMETILNNPGIPREKMMAFVRNSYLQSNRLSQLLRDIATITRMDEASEMIGKDELDLSALITDMLGDVAPQLEAKGITVACRLPQRLPMSGNPNLLHSVFRNLTDNAITYSGGNCIRIELTGESPTHYHFRFADNGIGIEQEHLAHIFERFYRIDKGRSRKLGGTGLGLSIVKNAILLHGGTISARPNPGGGVEFMFTIRKIS